ncbi:MAG TPA: ATP-binding protein [Longimicrobiales bacterium]
MGVARALPPSGERGKLAHMEALISAGAIALLDAVGDGITIQDASGQLQYANPAAARAIGFDSPEEMIALPLAEIRQRFELFDEDGAPLPFEQLPGRQALLGHTENERLVRFRTIATGEERWAVIKAQPVFNTDGSVRLVVNIWHDMTESMQRQRDLEITTTQLEETTAELEATIDQLEERTEEAEARAERHKFLAEAGRMLAASLDTEDTLRMIAHLAVPRLADWADVSLLSEGGALQRLETAHADPGKLRIAEQLEEKFPRDLRTDRAYAVARSGVAEMYPQISDEMLQQSARDAEHLELMRSLDLRSAMIVPMKIRENVLGIISFVRSGNLPPYNEEDLEFAESLAARSALALSNARLYREAQEANRTKADFLAVVSHELRTPLTAIFGYTELLGTGVAGEITLPQRAHLERIHASAAHLLSIIEDILAYARTEAGREQLHSDTFTVRDVIDEAVVLVNPIAEKKGLPIIIEVDDDTPLQTDRAKLRQILINLLGNAVKFTDSGQVTVRGARLEGDRLSVTVADTGIGIDPANFDRIFEPFRQLEPSMTRKTGGTGLGLAVSRRFATLLGGSLEVESTLGEGTCFTLTLPHTRPQP